MVLNALERSQKIARLSAAWLAFCSSGEQAKGCPLLVILDFDRTITSADRFDNAAAKRSFGVVVVTTLLQRDFAWCAGDGGGVQAAAAGGRRLHFSNEYVFCYVCQEAADVAQPRRVSRVIQITKQYLPLERDPLIPADQREVRPTA
jgi:hypothetical protein